MGSIGGSIVLGVLVVLFLYLKKRKRNNLTNQQPDFNKFIAGRDGGDLDDDDDESPLEEEDNKHIYHDNAGDNMVQNSKMGWFKSIFSNSGSGTSNASNSKLLGGAVGGGVAGASGGAGAGGIFRRLDRNGDDLERQAGGGYGSTGRNNNDTDNDFVYRGVTNSNNLDQIFRSNNNTSSAARNSTIADGSAGVTSGTNSAKHTRMSSYGHPLANPDDFNFDEESYPIAGGVIGGGEDYRPHTAFSSHYDDDQSSSGSTSDDGEFHPSDYDSFIMPGDEAPEEPAHQYRPRNIFSDGRQNSTNSLSRFHEDDIF